jgi:hypothetical protein
MGHTLSTTPYALDLVDCFKVAVVVVVFLVRHHALLRRRWLAPFLPHFEVLDRQPLTGSSGVMSA